MNGGGDDKTDGAPPPSPLEQGGVANGSPIRNLNPSPWMNAWDDPLANLKTCSSCIRLGDVYGDNESKLIVCDLNKKLKLFKGTALASESSILETPVAIAITYPDSVFPRIPNIAVAAGPHIFLYRQLKPYKKWTCPPVDIAPEEVDIWDGLKKATVSADEAVKRLDELRESGVKISSRSARLLSTESPVMQREFITANNDEPYVQNTSITCMEEIKRESEDANAVNHLVVGTESNLLIILHQEPEKSSWLCKVSLPATPVILCVSGLLEIEWRIYVACRDGKIYVVKNGELRGTAILTGTVMDLCSQAVAMTRQDKSLWVASMDRAVTCYTARGKKKNSIQFNDDIVDICVIAVKRAKVSHLLLVALATGEIRMLRESSVVYSFMVEAPVIALQFGAYGREDSTLIVVHGKGSLSIKIWRRLVDADSLVTASGPPPEQDIPIPVPKKTKVFTENAQRERETASSMFKKFQEDLSRIRLDTMRAYVKTITGGMGTSSMSTADVKLQAAVMGLGPQFILKLTLHNVGTTPIFHSTVMVVFDPNTYTVSPSSNSASGAGPIDFKQAIVVPALIPGVKHFLEVKIRCIDPQGRSGNITVVLQHSQSGNDSSFPIVSANVKMPISELDS